MMHLIGTSEFHADIAPEIVYRPARSLPVLMREWSKLRDTSFLARLERDGRVWMLRRFRAAWPSDIPMPPELQRVAT